MSEEGASETPLLDEWRAEVGDDAVVAAVETARAQIADGSLRGFSDKEELLAYLQVSRRVGVTWRIFLTDSCQPDLDALTPADRTALTEDLFAWVLNGPPRTRARSSRACSCSRISCHRGSASPTSSTTRFPMSASSGCGGAEG